MAPTAEVKNAPAGGSTASVPDKVDSEVYLKHKRRYCRIEGCQRIVKSQGLCQRHGAKPKTCKVEGCTKQAQGNFDKMCKAHFKAMKRQTTPIPKVVKSAVPPPAQGQSVFDDILPRSISYSAAKGGVMPLIAHLKHGFDNLKPPAWHRNEERAARGIIQIDNPAQQLEGWERELVWMEILVLTGVPGASFRHLARAWGRDKGFHMVLAQFICERHGDVERKKRQAEKKAKSDADGDAKKPLRFKRRKASRYGLEAKQAEKVGADAWDPSLYGDVNTNEALASEIFDFSEKEFHRVTAKYRGMSNASVGSESASTGSPNVMAQAAMTAILGDKNGDHIQQMLPDAAVALAAMNRILAPLPHGFKLGENDQTPKKSYIAPTNALQNQSLPRQQTGRHDSISGHLGESQLQSHEQQQQQLQQTQLHPQQHHTSQQTAFVSPSGQPAECIQQGHDLPQVQKINQATTVFDGLEQPPQYQVTKQPVYTLAAASQTEENSGNLAQLNVHGTQNNQHSLSDHEPHVTQLSGSSDGQFQQDQNQAAQTRVVVAQQQVHFNAVHQQQAQQVMQQTQAQPLMHQQLHQHGHSMMQQQPQQGQPLLSQDLSAQPQQPFKQLAPQQPSGMQYSAPSQDQGQLNVFQSHFDSSLNHHQQPPQQQQHQVKHETQTHDDASQQQAQQQVIRQQVNQNQYMPQDHQPQHVSHHGVSGQQTQFLSQALQPAQPLYNDQPQLQQHVAQQVSQVQHAQLLANQQATHRQYSKLLQQKHVSQQDLKGQSTQFSQPAHQQYPSQHQEQQQVTQPTLVGQHALAVHNQREQNLETTQFHDPSHQPTSDDIQPPHQHQMNQQVHYSSNAPQQQDQQWQVSNHTNIQVSQFNPTWPSRHLPQMALQQHNHHHRNHRRQRSQPVYFQQGQSPDLHRHHRRQFSQPAYLHDLGEVLSFSQQQVSPSQSVQQTFQQNESSISHSVANAFTQSNDHPVHVQQQEHKHEYHDQQQVLPEGNQQQEPQASQLVFHSTTAQPGHSHDIQHSQDGSFRQPQQQDIHNAMDASNENPSTHQLLIPHPQDDVGNDPLDIHHEMHVAQANGSHYHEENHSGI